VWRRPPQLASSSSFCTNNPFPPCPLLSGEVPSPSSRMASQQGRVRWRSTRLGRVRRCGFLLGCPQLNQRAQINLPATPPSPNLPASHLCPPTPLTNPPHFLYNNIRWHATPDVI
jgi:hypothetical protein